MVIQNMRGTTSAAAAAIRAVGAGQRQGSCDHAGGLRIREHRSVPTAGQPGGGLLAWSGRQHDEIAADVAVLVDVKGRVLRSG
jgi:hypothetical protein